ncbi:glycoside hydrolase family 43 protein [Serratia aquatilis]|uniref:Family 43 glycosylhydrolase n=1 Tax=Serratia aquatilis TaxID=1737515 RepID=A0ABV6EIN9_9GAMM
MERNMKHQVTHWMGIFILLMMGNIMPLQANTTFTNPILSDGADPWVVHHSDGYYYYTQTTASNITLWRTTDLSDLDNAEQKVVWMPKPNSVNSEHVWAPELHYLDGRWYIYFAASAGDMTKQRMYVLQSENSDPFSDYHYPAATQSGKIADASDKWAIDGTIFEFAGKRYFIWSGWEGDTNEQQRLYIARMATPWQLIGERVELSRPEFVWEQVGTPQVNEAPQVLLNPKGQAFIVYSASGSWTDDYCLGLLLFNGGDPMVAANWSKHPTPVFSKNESADIYGPGHNGFFTDNLGQSWLIYHAAKFKGAGWAREIHMQPFGWHANGLPSFGLPIGSRVQQDKPS